MRVTVSTPPDVLSSLDGEERLRLWTKNSYVAQSFSLSALLPCCGCGFCAAAGLAQGFDPGLCRAADDPIRNTVRHSDTLTHSFDSAGFRHSAGFGVSAT